MKNNSRELTFLRRYPTEAVVGISGFYPLSGEQLQKYRKVLLWHDVCQNTNIEWSIGLIQTFLQHLTDEKGRLDIMLHYNERLPVSVELIRQFENRLYWDRLGELKTVQQSEAIQQAFEKQLAPVNAWIDMHRIHTAGNASDRPETSYIHKIKHWATEEIERHKEQLDWHDLSASGSTCDWSISFIERFEKYIDIRWLFYNYQAWQACFGSLGDEDIDLLLIDKEFISRVEYDRKEKAEIRQEIDEQEDPVEASHYLIPDCHTYDYFLEKNRDKFPDAKP